MLIENLSELDAFMPHLLANADGDEVFYAVSSKDDFLVNPFEYLTGSEASLSLPAKTLTFSYLFSSNNNYMNLQSFYSENDLYHRLNVLSKKCGSYCLEFPLTSGKKHYLYACSIYSWPEKDAFIVCLRRLKFFEEYLGEYSEKTKIDYTTGLLNKECCLQKINSIKLNDQTMVFFADLNNFKLINDVYGHIMGDKILRSFSDCLSENKPENAFIYRFGGDEFVGVFPGYDASGIADWLNKVEEAFLGGGNLGLPVSFSAGCCLMSPKIKAPLYLVRCSDKAMYVAKKKDVPYYILNEKEVLKIIKDDQKNA